jgi:hypothetical protein
MIVTPIANYLLLELHIRGINSILETIAEMQSQKPVFALNFPQLRNLQGDWR